MSKTLLRTDIVSRTVVTVQYSEAAVEKPSVQIDTTPMDEIEARISEDDNARIWSEKEIEEIFAESDHPAVKKLFQLARERSIVDQFVAAGKKRNPAFGFYHRGIGPDGAERTLQVYNYRDGDPHARIYLNMLEACVPEQKFNIFKHRLEELFPTISGRDLREPFIPLQEIEEKWKEFRGLILSLQDENVCDAKPN